MSSETQNQVSEAEFKAFFQALNDTKPLKPNDDRYVSPYSSPESDPILYLKKQFDWSDEGSVAFLSGQRGTGKTTQLLRFQSLFSNKDTLCFHIDLKEHLNLDSPIDVISLLAGIALGFQEQIRERYQKDFSEPSLWDRVKGFASRNVEIEHGDVNALIGRIRLSLKENPDIRKELKKEKDKLIGPLADQIREHLFFLRKWLLRHEGRDLKIILLLDSLEQLRGTGQDANETYESISSLFSKFSQYLKLHPFFVVYTIPPYLGALNPSFESDFGKGMVKYISGVPIFRKLDSGEIEIKAEGISIFKQILTKRYQGWARIFTDSQVKNLAVASAGDLRDFLSFLKESVLAASFKDGPFPVEDSFISEMKQRFSRQLALVPENDRKWLDGVLKTKKHGLQEMDQLTRLVRLLDAKLIIQYGNGQDWYDINPLLKEELEQNSLEERSSIGGD